MGGRMGRYTGSPDTLVLDQRIDLRGFSAGSFAGLSILQLLWKIPNVVTNGNDYIPMHGTVQAKIMQHQKMMEALLLPNAVTCRVSVPPKGPGTATVSSIGASEGPRPTALLYPTGSRHPRG